MCINKTIVKSDKSLNNIFPNFRCTYNIKNINAYTQIINNGYEGTVNDEIELKIKIIQDGKIQNLTLKKKIDSIGLHTIDYIINENLKNCSFIFNQCSTLKKINFINFKTDQVTSLNSMFNECNILEYLDLSNFDTKNVTDMRWMFNKCYKLKEIKGINDFKTSNVNNMKSMFQNCNSLEYLCLYNWKTSNVTDMKLMFSECRSLKEIVGINNFDTKNVISMNSIFNRCILI